MQTQRQHRRLGFLCAFKRNVFLRAALVPQPNWDTGSEVSCASPVPTQAQPPPVKAPPTLQRAHLLSRMDLHRGEGGGQSTVLLRGCSSGGALCGPSRGCPHLRAEPCPPP